MSALELEPKEEMAINKTEWEQIKTQMRDALSEHEKGKLQRFKAWSPLGVAVAITSFVLLQWNGYTVFRTHTEDKLEALEKRFANVESIALEARTKTLASNPTDPKGQNETRRLLAIAREQSVSIPAPVIEQAGSSFIKAAKTNLGAWDVALDFISFRTTQNDSPYPLDKFSPLPPGKTWLYDLGYLPGKKPDMRFSSGVGVPADQSARLEIIGRNQNASFPDGPAFITVIGGSAILDMHYIRQVIFNGVEIHYSGKPAILERVTFINCTFVMDNDDPGRRLAQEVLANQSFSWSA